VSNSADASLLDTDSTHTFTFECPLRNVTVQQRTGDIIISFPDVTSKLTLANNPATEFPHAVTLVSSGTQLCRFESNFSVAGLHVITITLNYNVSRLLTIPITILPGGILVLIAHSVRAAPLQSHNVRRSRSLSRRRCSCRCKNSVLGSCARPTRQPLCRRRRLPLHLNARPQCASNDFAKHHEPWQRDVSS
jgi:hypothetical protein